MSLQLAKTAGVEVIAGQLQTSPGFMLDGITVYGGRDQDGVVGSSPGLFSSADTFWLDQHTLQLVSVAFGIPERLPEPEELEKLPLWQDAPEQEGIVRLPQWHPFDVEVADVRWIDEDGRALTGVLRRAFEDAQERLRLRIAPDLELWFADGEYCGWSLLNPARYLIEYPEDRLTPIAEPVDRPLVALLYDYMMLVVEPFIEQMDDQDPVLRNRLLGLYERARHMQGQEQRRRIIQLAIADKLDRFYDLQV